MEPRKLLPSEVTEPGWYWTDGGDDFWPAVNGTLEVVLICRADRDLGRSGLEVFDPGCDYGNAIQGCGHTWFVGPLVPPVIG